MQQLLFWKNKKILVTGHTGFKGSWLCRILSTAGADVTGYALDNMGNPCLFNLIKGAQEINSVIGDIRNLDELSELFERTKPEIVFHLAAQPIVRESYQNPVYTYETNVMGTVNILECIRCCDSVRSFVNVTTDKVYKNREWERGYRENEELNGYDPYSNSKSCSELVTASYQQSFFRDRQTAITTARAGNVIGGGDFAVDRIIPDCIRAAAAKKDIVVRNPYSVRPYQHVLEPIMAYLMIAERQYKERQYAGSYNVGPDDRDCITTGEIVTMFCKKWEEQTGAVCKWINQYDGGPHEANFLKLDCSKLKTTFQWNPVWNIELAVEKVVEWSALHESLREQSQEIVCRELRAMMDKQIKEYCGEAYV